MFSNTNVQEFKNTMCNILRTMRHVLAIDAFTNISILIFLQIYCDENICIVDNKYQPHIGKTVEFIYDLNNGTKAIQIGYDFLRQVNV